MELKTVANTQQHGAIIKPRKALRLTGVVAKTGLSKTHIYRLISRGDFVKGVHVSERVVVWDEAAIDAWLAEKFGVVA